MATTLGQIVGIHKGTRTSAQRDFDAIYKTLQKQELFSGFDKTHEPLDGNLPQPHSEKLVQANALALLKKMEKVLTRAFDVEALKDYADTEATADLVVASDHGRGDNTVLLHDVPVSHLLWLEKQFANFLTVFRAIPVQSAAENWGTADNLPDGVFRTPEEQVPSTKKAVEFKIVVPPTDRHPADVREVTQDVQSGTYKTVKFTAALPVSQKEVLVERATILLEAVKQAIVVANHTEVGEDIPEGETIFSYLFDGVLR